ncbi:hypothetical protein [Fibrobacter sp.]|uniref:hypothetical protein n=1 Tax=Fibrobacter sp. TaxID=35828 RepID=UPI00388E9CA5
MIVTEELENDLIRTYSDRKVFIRGGKPEGLYAEAIDPKKFGRTYVETDIPIPEDDEEEEP